jgi:hypothetical protein
MAAWRRGGVVVGRATHALRTPPLEAYIAVQGCYSCDTDKEQEATDAATAIGYWIPWLD